MSNSIVWLQTLNKWRIRHVSENNLVLFLSFLVGLLGGAAAIILKNVLNLFHYLITYRFSVNEGNYLYFVLPLIGIAITFIYVRYSVKDDISHGISKILFAISRKKGYIAPHNNYSSIIASSITIGCGGSVGTEAPIAMAGASLGSNLGRWMQLGHRQKILLIGCGATATVAAIFKAPIASIIFTFEVLMIDLSTWALIPLLISAVTATSLSYIFLGKEVVFNFTQIDPLQLKNLAYYALLGIFTGFVSLYFTRMTLALEVLLKKFRNPYYKLLFGGALLGLLIYFFPPLFGEGYLTLQKIQSNHPNNIADSSLFYSVKDNYWYFMLYLFLIIIFKAFAVSLTTGSGGVGGVFAPSLFLGGISGLLFGEVLNSSPYIFVSERNFSVMGMAGVMSGVMHAPLTAIFLIAELTGGFALLLPIMLTSTVSFLTILYFEKHSIYTKQLAKEGNLITHHKDKAILTLMRIRHILEDDMKMIAPDGSLRDMVKTISNSSRNIFPVVDENGKFLGIVHLDSIRQIIFNINLYDNTYVKDFMVFPDVLIEIHDSMDTVMNKFEESGAWNLPVVDKDQKYLGFLSKSRIFDYYRELMVDFSVE